MVTKDRGP